MTGGAGVWASQRGELAIVIVASPQRRGRSRAERNPENRQCSAVKPEPKSDRAASVPQKTSMLRIVLGTLLVLAGLSSALVTVLARRTNENTLAGVAAILSLL